jgi:hypothetical protein
MNRQICKYSIIRFQPYVETEEFANIGIVLYATASKSVMFRLLRANDKRVNQFFEPLNKAVFKEVLDITRTELERVAERMTQTFNPKMDSYEELIKPRQDIIQYSQNRVLFSTDINNTLAELYEHYVKRSFVHKEGHEEIMQRRIQVLLKAQGLDNQFKEHDVGEKKYTVRLPFVNSERKAAIKPIHFTHPDSSKLIEHGLSWLMKVQQLNRYGYINPEHVLFAYTPPEYQRGVLFQAFTDIKEEIERAGIITATIANDEDITGFAKRFVSDQSPY